MGYLAGFKILIGAAVYPSSKGEKITALAGVCLTVIAVWALVRSFTLYPLPPSNPDDSWIAFARVISYVLWIFVATAYKGFVIRGFQITPLGWAGLALCMTGLFLGMIAAAYHAPVDHQPLLQANYYEWLAVGGLVVANGWVDIFMLIHKILREQGMLS